MDWVMVMTAVAAGASGALSIMRAIRIYRQRRIKPLPPTPGLLTNGEKDALMRRLGAFAENSMADHRTTVRLENLIEDVVRQINAQDEEIEKLKREQKRTRAQASGT